MRDQNYFVIKTQLKFIHTGFYPVKLLSCSKPAPLFLPNFHIIVLERFDRL
jgi:hypothetical protein